MLKKLIVLLFWVGFACCYQTETYGQSTTNNLGLNPSGLVWLQIDTDTVQVVFPKSAFEEGQRVAGLLSYLHGNHTASIGEKRGKITIILHNRTVIPNGFVSLSPFRSEFYLSPPQFGFLGTGRWIDLLAIHEYRHVQQNINFNLGVTKAVSSFFGQNGWAFMRQTAVPRWFMEGDAIIAETAFSQAGRGRQPAFDMEYRALRLEGKHYNYEKAQAGSFKDFVPSHYHLGYYLTTQARRTHGQQVWANVLADAGRFRGIFFPFSHSLKKYTSQRTPQLYRATMQALDSLYQNKYAELYTANSRLVNQHKKKRPTNYRFPRFEANGTLLVEKSAFNQIPTIYRIYPDGREEKITVRGFNVQLNASLSVANQKALWAETTYHERWVNESYSILRVYDLQNKSTKKLTSKSKLFSPSLSPDGSKIVALSDSENQAPYLSIIDADSGLEIAALPNNEGYHFTQPTFGEGGEKIYAVAHRNGENALVSLDADGQYETLLGFSNQLITFPVQRGDYVYFSAAFTGTHNIFALKLTDRSLYQLTDSPLGAFEPDVNANGTLLAYSEFSAMGYNIQLLPLNPGSWQAWGSHLPANAISFYKPLVAQEEANFSVDSLAERQFEVKSYAKKSGIINLHSLQPFINPPTVSLSAQFLNKFSTLGADATVAYNANEENFVYSANATFGQWYPMVNAGVSYGNNRNRIGMIAAPDLLQDSLVRVSFYNRRWQETDINTGLRIPFNFTGGAYITNALLAGNLHFMQADYRSAITDSISSGNFNAFDFRFRLFRQRPLAPQHINPRFAQFVDVGYKRTFNSTRNQGSVFRFRTDLYFPGLWQNHSFYLSYAFQVEGALDSYKFRDQFFYPRGYGSLFHDNISRLAVNYSLPLLYPDLALGSLAFLKRVKVNFFFDYAHLQVNDLRLADMVNLTDFRFTNESIPGFTQNFRSFGAELSFDFRAFRILEMDLGVRYSYLLDGVTNNYSFDFLVLRVGG